MAIGDAINLKIIDLGMARYVGCCPMKTVCGTYTTAPEVLRESYDERCDVWSVGVVTFIMLSGKRPFESLNVSGPLTEAGKAAMTTNILAGRYSFGTENWRGVIRGQGLREGIAAPSLSEARAHRERLCFVLDEGLNQHQHEDELCEDQDYQQGLSSGNITVLGSMPRSPDTASDDEATSIAMSELKDRGEGGKDPPTTPAPGLAPSTEQTRRISSW